MSEFRKCFKCGIVEGSLVKKKGGHGGHAGYYAATIIEHHIKYNPEIIVDCCMSCHVKLHQKIRRENSCPLSPEEVHTITRKCYQKRSRKHIVFSETIAKSVRLFDHIIFHINTGNIVFESYFHANGVGKSLYYIDCD